MARDSTPLVLNLDSSLTIDHASELKREISSALSNSALVHLNFSGVEELDLACLQVLFAARATARAGDKGLVFTGLPSERVRKRLRAGGFLRSGNGDIESLEAALIDS